MATTLLLFSALCAAAVIHNGFALPELGRPMKEEFLLDPNFVQLNQGAYGSFPRDVRTALLEFQTRIELNPERWMRLDLRNETLHVRQLLGEYMNADPDDLVVVPNTTGGINAVFRSLKFNSGDKILYLSTVYPNMRGLVQYIVDSHAGAVSSVEFPVNFPVTNDELVSNFDDFVNSIDGIRIAIIDHLSPFPGVLFPIEELIPILKAKGILVLIDGAHALGQIPVDLTALDVDYYVTSCYKWLYAVRGTSVMYVKREHQTTVHPAIIARNYAQPARFQPEFGWTGTLEFSPYMTVPAALAFRTQIGEEVIRNYTHTLAVQGANLVRARLNTIILQTDDQIASMVDVQLPIDDPESPNASDGVFWDSSLLNRFNVYVTVHKHNGKIWARFGAQIYNDLNDFEYAAEALLTLSNELNEASRRQNDDI